MTHTQEQIDAVAAAMWRQYLITLGYPEELFSKRTPEEFNSLDERSLEMYRSMAIAALDAMPVTLCSMEWEALPNINREEYNVFVSLPNDRGDTLYEVSYDNGLGVWAVFAGSSHIFPNPYSDGEGMGFDDPESAMEFAKNDLIQRLRLISSPAKEGTVQDMLDQVVPQSLTREVELRKALDYADEFLGKLQTIGSEPLNSINGSRDRASRGYFTAQLRNSAREVWVVIGNVKNGKMTFDEAVSALSEGEV